MGGSVSTFIDNQELIDKLYKDGYVNTEMIEIERILRLLDRSHYYLPEDRPQAHKDISYRKGILHLSAPCIYAEVLNHFELAPGLRFLNLGSGSGYFSTLVGLVLGPYGVNHGVELHADNVKYADERLSELRRLSCAKVVDPNSISNSSSEALWEREFCLPQFFVGNCLRLSSDFNRYDRIYCGAGCIESTENVLRHLLTLGGILIVPVNDQLVKVKRLSENEWLTEDILPVSFAALVDPSDDDVGPSLSLPHFEVPALTLLVRAVIRDRLRQVIIKNNGSEWPVLERCCRRSHTTKVRKNDDEYEKPNASSIDCNDDDNNWKSASCGKPCGKKLDSALGNLTNRGTLLQSCQDAVPEHEDELDVDLLSFLEDDEENELNLEDNKKTELDLEDDDEAELDLEDDEADYDNIDDETSLTFLDRPPPPTPGSARKHFFASQHFPVVYFEEETADDEDFNISDDRFLFFRGLFWNTQYNTSALDGISPIHTFDASTNPDNDDEVDQFQYHTNNEDNAKLAEDIYKEPASYSMAYELKLAVNALPLPIGLQRYLLTV